MAAPDPDILYVSGLVAAIFRSPTWVTPISTFVDQNCGIFEDQEENKLEYTMIHNAFKQLVDELLEAHLVELSVTTEQFTRFCQHGLTGDNEFHRELVEQLLSVDDFLIFKAMMIKRNAQLYRQALEMFGGFSMQAPSAPGGDGLLPPAPLPHPDMSAQALAAPEAAGMPPAPDYSEQLAAQEKLEAEHAELEAERVELHRKCVEAELQLAMALSMQLQKRLQLMEALSEILEAITEMRDGAEGALAAEAAASEAREGAPLQVEPMYAVSDGPDPAALQAEAEAAEAAAQRERAQRAVEVARQQAAAKAAAQASQEERRARAEHLKRQRDMLVEKKKRDRDQQLAAHEEATRTAAPSKAVEVARTWQEKTERNKLLQQELSGQAPEPAPPSPVAQDTAAADMRRMLIRQLKGTF